VRAFVKFLEFVGKNLNFDDYRVYVDSDEDDGTDPEVPLEPMQCAGLYNTTKVCADTIDEAFAAMPGRPRAEVYARANEMATQKLEAIFADMDSKEAAAAAAASAAA